jgi:hypothetical protein
LHLPVGGLYALVPCDPVVEVRRAYEEDPDQALDRHYAAHPEDRDADVVIFQFCDDAVSETQDRGPPAAPAREKS